MSISIDVPNLVEAIRFYTNAFGFTESSAPAPGLAVLHAGNTKICLLEKRAGTRASTYTEETRRYERHWTPVHLTFMLVILSAEPARALDAGAKKEHVFENAKYGVCCLLQRSVWRWLLSHTEKPIAEWDKPKAGVPSRRSVQRLWRARTGD